MENKNKPVKPGDIDNIFKINERNQYNESGQKYVCIKPPPEEKKRKSIN
tara:strand:- start:142 stop:288 length:147 start_codon:yes stop_codon:yes gene_type:complete